MWNSKEVAGIFGSALILWVVMLTFNLALWGGLIWGTLALLNHYGVI
jgi:hypothetical protein